MKSIIILLFCVGICYGQDNLYINPDGNVISLTILQNFEYNSEFNSDEFNYKFPNITNWSFLLKYPTSKRTTFLLHYSYSTSDVFMKDNFKYQGINKHIIGIGAIIYFK